MAFMCPIRIGRSSKKKRDRQGEKPAAPAIGRITGSASIETLVRVGLEKEHGLGPNSEVVVLHDFTPCVDDEIGVRRGEIVHTLYQENDWIYVISGSREGFIPQTYCAPVGSPLAEMALSISKKKSRDRPPEDHQQSFLESSIAHSDLESVDTPSCCTDVHPFFKDPAGRFLVLYSFIARDENDISIERGELVTVLNREDPDWFWVQRYNGHEGFVPSAFIFPADVINSHAADSPETASEAPTSASATTTLRQEATSQKPLAPKERAGSTILDSADFKDFNDASGNGASPQKEYRYETKSGIVSLHTYHNTGTDRAFSAARSTADSDSLSGNNLNLGSSVGSQRGGHGVSEGSNGNCGSLKSSVYKDSHGNSNSNSNNNNNNNSNHNNNNINHISGSGTHNHKSLHESQVGTIGNRTKLQDHNSVSGQATQTKDGGQEKLGGSRENLDPTGKENDAGSQRGTEPYRAKATELVVLYDHDTVAEYELPIKRKELVYADLNCQNAEGWYWVYSPRLNEYGYVPRGFVIAAQPATTSL